MEMDLLFVLGSCSTKREMIRWKKTVRVLNYGSELLV